MSATNAYNTNRLYWTTQFQQYIRFVLQGVQVTIDNTNRLYCRWFKLPPTIQTVCIVIDNTNRLYCSWLAIQTVCIVVGLQYKRFVLSASQYKPFVLSSMQYKLFVLQLRATIQTVCIAGGSSYHTCTHLQLFVFSSFRTIWQLEYAMHVLSIHWKLIFIWSSTDCTLILLS